MQFVASSRVAVSKSLFPPALKFLFPFSLLITLGQSIQWEAPYDLAARMTLPSISFALEQISEPFPDVLPSNSPGVHTLWLPIIPLQMGRVL